MLTTVKSFALYLQERPNTNTCVKAIKRYQIYRKLEKILKSHLTLGLKRDILEQNYHTAKFFTEDLLAIKMKIKQK